MSDQCAKCGEPIPAEEWHPVVTLRDEDGEVEIRAFCAEECRAAWEDDRD